MTRLHLTVQGGRGHWRWMVSDYLGEIYDWGHERTQDKARRKGREIRDRLQQLDVLEDYKP